MDKLCEDVDDGEDRLNQRLLWTLSSQRTEIFPQDLADETGSVLTEVGASMTWVAAKDSK